MSTSIQLSNGIEFTDVPPPITPTLKVVFGDAGTWMLRELLHRVAHRERRTDEAERAVAVAARALERHAIPLAADARRA